MCPWPEPAPVRQLGRDRRSPGRGPLPHRQPVLPQLRLQGGLARRAHSRRDHPAAAHLRRRSRAAPGGAGSHQLPAGAAGALFGHAGPPAPCRFRPVLAARGGHRRGLGAAGPGPAHGRGAGFRQRGDSLWPDGDLRPGDCLPTRRRCPDRCHYLWPASRGYRGALRGWRRQSGADRRAGGSADPRLQPDEGLLQ
ncbi:hypothetical protein D3C85_1226260 [compost metagenome]